MPIDLTPRWDEFAVYLPAIQTWYSTKVHDNKALSKARPFPSGIKLTDLDFLNPKSKLWHYKYALYSAGQFRDFKPKACSVTQRVRNGNTIVVGDSGGYQIGMGTFPGMESFKRIKTAEGLCEAWRSRGDIREKVVNWLEATTDYAMTIDMPLWVAVSTTTTSPFKVCSVEQLTKLSVENLEFIAQNRQSRTKWLNVLQGTDPKNSKYWWDRVKKYRFGGWALAGSVGWRGGLDSVLHNVLMMRDDDAFADGMDWMHVLGVSQVAWAVLLTAIQKGLRAQCNPNLRISYDSASPFQTVGKIRKLMRYPKFQKDFKTWVMSAQPNPFSSKYAGTKGKFHFPFASPIGEMLTLDHINVKSGSYEAVPSDFVSDLLLLNHTLYIYIRAFLEANELAFMGRREANECVPQDLLDAIDLIQELIGMERWSTKLKRNAGFLNDVSMKISSMKATGVAIPEEEMPYEI